MILIQIVQLRQVQVTIYNNTFIGSYILRAALSKKKWTFTEAEDLIYTFISPVVTLIGTVGNSAFLILLLAVPSMQSSVTALILQ